MRHPFTAMFTSLLSIGVGLKDAMEMGFGEASWLLTARSELSGTKSENDGVREATQADIRKLLCG